MTSSEEKSRCLNLPGVGGRAGIPWENHLAPGGEHLAGPLCPHARGLASPDKGQLVLVAAGLSMEHRAGRDVLAATGASECWGCLMAPSGF